jgi:hypothetical protein
MYLRPPSILVRWYSCVIISQVFPPPLPFHPMLVHFYPIVLLTRACFLNGLLTMRPLTTTPYLMYTLSSLHASLSRLVYALCRIHTSALSYSMPSSPHHRYARCLPTNRSCISGRSLPSHHRFYVISLQCRKTLA